MTPSELVLSVLQSLLPGGWPEGSLEISGAPFRRSEFALAFAAARRRWGDAELQLSEEQARRVNAASSSWVFAALPAERGARIALLLTTDRWLDEPTMVELVDASFRRGDNHERAAVLRALALLREPQRYLALASQACRTHVQTVFEALACENPYPAAHLSDAGFNQLVLKAMFIGVKLGRVLGLEARVTPELTRMAHDYANERRAAGRPVPADIGMLG